MNGRKGEKKVLLRGKKKEKSICHRRGTPRRTGGRRNVIARQPFRD